MFMFEFNYVQVYNSTIFKLTELTFFYFFKKAYANKKYERENSKILCLIEKFVIESHSSLG